MDEQNLLVTVPLAGIEEESIVDGPGLRMVIFTQGCPHHCPGCHNPQTHPFEGGTPYTLKSLLKRYGKNPILRGMTFSGGEPFVHAEALAILARAVHEKKGTVVTFTGYTYEALLQKSRSDEAVSRLLEETDLLIDGPYVEALRDLELRFRGSSNQRLLDRAMREEIRKELTEK